MARSVVLTREIVGAAFQGVLPRAARRRLQVRRSLAVVMTDSKVQKLLNVRDDSRYGRTIAPRYSLNVSAIEQYCRSAAARRRVCLHCYENLEFPDQHICSDCQAVLGPKKGVTSDTLFDSERVSDATPQPNTQEKPKAELASEAAGKESTTPTASKAGVPEMAETAERAVSADARRRTSDTVSAESCEFPASMRDAS
jgi:hypothetical protein